jgi:hypothetical protein
VHCFQPDTPAGELFRVPGDSCQATNGGLHDEICSCTGLYAEECSVDSLLQDTMICHPTTQRCEVPCTIDSDCPATEMVCDDDLSICTHPICEA